MALTGNESLSDKRRRAGRLGAAARWGVAPENGKLPSRNGKNGKLPAAEHQAKIVANQDGDTAEVYLYGEISRWGCSAKDVAEQVSAIKAATLDVYINSPGGSVFEGLAILNALRRHSATVRVTIDGIAASAASFIAMAGDEIIMSRNSQMMIHDALAYVDVWGMANPADIDAMVAELKGLQGELERQSDNIAEVYAEAAAARGGDATASAWRDLMRAETWYFANEAVEAGLADRVEGDATPGSEDQGAPADTAGERVASIRESFKFRNREDAGTPPVAASTPEPEPESPAPEPPQVDLGALIRNSVKEAAS